MAISTRIYPLISRLFLGIHRIVAARYVCTLSFLTIICITTLISSIQRPPALRLYRSFSLLSSKIRYITESLGTKHRDLLFILWHQELAFAAIAHGLPLFSSLTASYSRVMCTVVIKQEIAVRAEGRKADSKMRYSGLSLCIRIDQGYAHSSWN